jgi:hypothetical protein
LCSTRPVVAHIQSPGEVHPRTAAAGYPTVLVAVHIGSAVDRTDFVIPNFADPSGRADSREAGTGLEEDRGVEVGQQDGTNLTMVVGCLCLHKTRSCSFCHTAASTLVAKDENLDLLESRWDYCTAVART